MPKVFLDAIELLADPRGGKPKLIGSVINIASRRDRDKCYKIVEFHLGPTHPIHLNGLLLMTT